jgi:hypothetical protein
MRHVAIGDATGQMLLDAMIPSGTSGFIQMWSEDRVHDGIENGAEERTVDPDRLALVRNDS